MFMLMHAGTDTSIICANVNPEKKNTHSSIPQERNPFHSIK